MRSETFLSMRYGNEPEVLIKTILIDLETNIEPAANQTQIKMMKCFSTLWILRSLQKIPKQAESLLKVPLITKSRGTQLYRIVIYLRLRSV